MKNTKLILLSMVFSMPLICMNVDINQLIPEDRQERMSELDAIISKKLNHAHNSHKASNVAAYATVAFTASMLLPMILDLKIANNSNFLRAQGALAGIALIAACVTCTERSQGFDQEYVNCRNEYDQLLYEKRDEELKDARLSCQRLQGQTNADVRLLDENVGRFFSRTSLQELILAGNDLNVTTESSLNFSESLSADSSGSNSGVISPRMILGTTGAAHAAHLVLLNPTLLKVASFSSSSLMGDDYENFSGTRDENEVNDELENQETDL